ncbi:Hypothetical_protein [Hexamita inflata]|uniref:Hypothetical_protein n=1 Tax=Hexamita inflata TaxID=28002 RepID=A0AA86QNK7_9EUKA|nr:Hypothetical protein HINF_LOCUS42700 [Hexamita inflata]
MKVYVTYDKAIQEFEIPAENNFISEVRKAACAKFNVKPEEVVFRSGTRPIREDMPLTENRSIIMAKVKPVKEAPKEEEAYEYEYEYEEVYEEDDDSVYGEGDDEEDDDDDEVDED